MAEIFLQSIITRCKEKLRNDKVKDKGALFEICIYAHELKKGF